MILSCNYHQDIGDFESILAKKLNSAMNKKEKTEMKNTSDIRRAVLNGIQAWVNTRYYPCFVDFKHVMGGMGEIASTHMCFLPCGHIEIHWDEVESADETIRAITNHITKVHEECHERMKRNSNRSVPDIEKVIFNYPATIIFWKDGTKTVVKCSEDDEFNPEVGMAMAISKKALGNKGNYCNEFKKWVDPFYEEAEETFTQGLSKLFEEIGERLSKHRFEAAFNRPIEKSESLKKENVCATCRYKELLGTSYPCCKCNNDYNEWADKEDVSE